MHRPYGAARYMAAAITIAAAVFVSACTSQPEAKDSQAPAYAKREPGPRYASGTVYETGSRDNRLQLRQSDIAAMLACDLNKKGRDLSSVTDDDVARAMRALEVSPGDIRHCRRELWEASRKKREAQAPAN